MKKILSLVTLLLFNPAFVHAVEFVIDHPVYPGTQIHFAYVAWGCTATRNVRLDEGACPSGTSFTPRRLPFHGADFYLNETGVCKSLGYMQAKANSSKSNEGSDGDRRLQVSAEGKLIGAIAGRSLTEITCIDQNPNYKPELLVALKKEMLVHPVTHLPIAQATDGDYAYEYGNMREKASDPNEVCKLFGYSHSLIASYLPGNNIRVEQGQATQVLSGGETKEVNALIMPSIMCVK